MTPAKTLYLRGALLLACLFLLASCQTPPAKAAAMQSAASAHGQATVQLFSKPIER